MENLFGKPVRRVEIAKRVTLPGIKIVTTTEMLASKTFIQFNDGSVMTTYTPEKIIGQTQHIEELETQEDWEELFRLADESNSVIELDVKRWASFLTKK